MFSRYAFRIKIVLSISIAFTLSAIIMRYVSFGDRPEFDRSKLLAEFTDAKDLAGKTMAAFASFPQVLLPGAEVHIVSNSVTGQSSSQQLSLAMGGGTSSYSNSSAISFSNGSSAPSQKQPTLPPQQTSSVNTYSSSSTPQQNTPTPAPPKPSSTPKPTKVPKPTAVPKLTLDARRPGNSFQEAISILSPIMCVPEAMMWATLDNEYGPWMGQVEADWDNRNTLHGADTTAVSGSTTITGVTQMMQDTWFRIKPYVMAKFNVSDMSLNVTFDSIAAGSYHQRNVGLAGQDKQPCDDWDVKYILYAACRYNGACPANTMGQKQYYNSYTYNVCNAYNRYTKGPKKNCQ